MFFASLKSLLAGLLFSCVATFIYLNVFVTPVDNISIIKNKTTGWKHEVYKAGYHWLWTGYIPNEWRVVHIPFNSSLQTIHTEYPLKYTEYFKITDIFKVKIRLQFKYILDKDHVLTLINTLDVSNSLNIDEAIKQELLNLLNLKLGELVYQSDTNLNILYAEMYKYIEKSLISDFNLLFPDASVKINMVKVIYISLPNQNVYNFQLQNIERIHVAQLNTLIKSIESDADAYHKRLNNQIEMERLYQISELLKKTPQLIDYLRYQNLNPNTQVIQTEKNITSDTRSNTTNTPGVLYNKDTINEKLNTGVLLPITK